MPPSGFFGLLENKGESHFFNFLAAWKVVPFATIWHSLNTVAQFRWRSSEARAM
jgi:hypothetical protein